MVGSPIELDTRDVWIIKGRVVVRIVLNACFDCKRRQQLPCMQKIADLPPDRVTSEKPLCTKIGAEYGPFYVKYGHCMKMHYGMLFMCLAARAVQIEIAHTMDTGF